MSATPDARRPQADFGAPISLPPNVDDVGPDFEGMPEPTLTGGYVPPLFAEADDTAAPRLTEPRSPPDLTVRISQGMPSYWEPEPDIAGNVGRVAREADDIKTDGRGKPLPTNRLS